ncbi:hypothetical protein KSS87_004426 [Heliosperma pusillum]|nr:hypothetical protein KSS87_004426 [Heliosperma pusillum]
MNKGVGLFSDIGKLAKEILYKDYSYDRKFSITTQAADGLVEVQYFHEHATIGSTLSLRNPPIFDVSATYGTATTVFGVETAYDTSISNFTKYNAAISMTKQDFCTTLTVADKGDLLTASWVQYLDQVKATIAVEFTNRFSEDGNTLTVGGSYNFDESTLIKLKLNNQGNFGVLLQHEIRPKTLLTMAAEFDYNSIDTSPKVGVSLALRP